MSIVNTYKILLPLSLTCSLLSATELSVVGCNSSLSKESDGCEAKSILVVEKKDRFKIQEETILPQDSQTNISKELKSISVNHKGKKLTVVRNIIDSERGCPPYCIVPIAIDAVKTVGELETLDFLKTLEEKGNHIVFDTRDSKYYNKGTIPGALNLPAHMLQEDSKYFNDVISILGIKKVDDNWQFKEVHNLLIFDNGLTDDKALKAIKSLLMLSYPADKILYYRGGFRTWKDLGLTVYEEK